MADSKIQSATLLPLVPALPWGNALKPGGQLTLPNPYGGYTQLESVAYHKPTYVCVLNVTVRNLIPSWMRSIGMLTYCITEDASYRLSGGIENANWSSAPTTLVQYGAYHVVESILERNNIASSLRSADTVCYVLSDETAYQLSGGLDNSNWTATALVAVRDAGTDLQGFITRDSELHWRDVAIATAIEAIARRAATVTGSDIPFPQIASTPVVTTARNSAVVVNASKQMSVAASITTVEFRYTLYPVVPGSMSVRVESAEGELSTSYDDGNGRIVSQGDDSDPDAVSPPGTITYGYVNYARGYVRVHIKACSVDTVCTVTYQQAAIQRYAQDIPANVADYTDTLTFTPVARNSVRLTVGGTRVIDDGRGHLVANGLVLGGSIDYISGNVQLRLVPTAAQSITFEYASLKYLDKSSLDLHAAQLSSPYGGPTSVAYVDNQSTPRDALVSDQDLYRRDLVLYEVLVLADQLFTRLLGPWDKAVADPTIPPKLEGSTTLSGAPITDVWSVAQASSEYKLPGFGMRWGPEVFADSDKYCAWRDNVLARYAAELSRNLASVADGKSRLVTLMAEDGRDFIVEADTTTEDEPVPAGAYFASRYTDFYYFDASQDGLILDTHQTSGALQLRPGDVVTWSTVDPTHSCTITEIIDGRYARALPSQTIAQSPTFVRRELAIDTAPRAFLYEPLTWERILGGYLRTFEYAKRLLVRVTDWQVDAYLASRSDTTVVAFISDYGIVGTGRDRTAAMVLGWEPDAIFAGGDNNYYDGLESTWTANNTPYLDFIATGKFYPAIGNHEYGPDADYGTDISVHLNHFHPPGWDTPNNLSGNNGRYYRVMVGEDIELFCLNPGWNSGQTIAASKDPQLFETQEPGGITPDSDQWTWCKNALADSTATWKFVFFHQPPYFSSQGSSYQMPGFKQMRWPFKEWGATAVFSGHLHAYERILVDGLWYIVGGWSGTTGGQINWSAPYVMGSTVKYQISGQGSTNYGAVKITANKEFCRFEAVTVDTTLDRKYVDTFTLWADPAGQDYQKREFTRTELEWSRNTGFAHQPVVRFNDAEYYAEWTDRALVRYPRQESDTYALIAEDARYRTFAATPLLGNDCGTIIYDKWLKTVKWKSRVVQDVAVTGPAAAAFNGYRNSQTVEIIADLPCNLDAESWRQKAVQMQVSPCHERVVEYRDFAPIVGVPYGYLQVQPTPTPITTQPAIMTTAGVAHFNTFAIDPILRTPGAQWYKFNLLVEPARFWYQHANTWKASSGVGAISANQDGVTLPPADVNNYQQIDTNVPKAAWELILPPGAYAVAFDWIDLNTTPIQNYVTLRWNGQVIQSEVWEAAEVGVTSTSPEAILTVSAAVAGTLTLTLNGPESADYGILLQRFSLRKTGAPVNAGNYRLNITLFDTDSRFTVLAPIPAQYARFSGVVGLPDVASTDWIDVRAFGSRDVINLEVALLDQPSVPLAIKGVELRTLVRVDQISNWRALAPVKDSYLNMAVDGIRARYTRHVWPTELRPVQGTGYGWTAATTAAWLERISVSEPRLKSAFRPARPGDLGRPALVPSGVYYTGTEVVSMYDMAQSTPNLMPWQPWMEPLGFLVASEDFWYVDLPAAPTRLLIADPSGENLMPPDPLVPPVSFDTADSSQYLVLL